jgi:hypothetical protein
VPGAVREQGVYMADRVGAEVNHQITYDVHLARRPPDYLRSRFPSMTVRSTGAQTALRERVEEPHQLDVLLEKVFSVGLVLTDVHRVSPCDTPRAGAGGRSGLATYEVRIAGELGEPLLRYLGWFHYVVPEQTLVRLTAASDDLNRFLRACTDNGARIDRVRRVGPA